MYTEESGKERIEVEIEEFDSFEELLEALGRRD